MKGVHMKKWITIAGGAGLVAVATWAFAPALAQVLGPVYQLDWFTIDSGGGTATVDNYELTGTVGQHDAVQSLTVDTYELTGGFWISNPVISETVCPDGPDNFFKSFGGTVNGDTTMLCDSDDIRLRVRQFARVTPQLPFIRFDIWTNTVFEPGAVSALSYHVEGYCNAIVSGGQTADTLQTSIRNFATLFYALQDVRATGAFADEFIDIDITANADEYIRASDGRIQLRMEAFFPGTVVQTNWEIRVDVYETTVNQ
jgi:hypothetical protein